MATLFTEAFVLRSVEVAGLASVPLKADSCNPLCFLPYLQWYAVVAAFFLFRIFLFSEPHGASKSAFILPNSMVVIWHFTTMDQLLGWLFRLNSAVALQSHHVPSSCYSERVDSWFVLHSQ